MRIEIKTNEKVKDPDIKALYLLKKALEISTPQMRNSNLNFAIQSFNANLK